MKAVDTKFIKKVFIEIWRRFLWTAKCFVYKDECHWELQERAMRIPTIPPFFRWRWFGRDNKMYYWYVSTPEIGSERDLFTKESKEEHLSKSEPIIQSAEVVPEYKSIVVGKNRMKYESFVPEDKPREQINLKDFFEEPLCSISEYPDEIEIIYIGYRNGILYYHTPYFEEFSVKYRKVEDTPLLEKERDNEQISGT